MKKLTTLLICTLLSCAVACGDSEETNNTNNADKLPVPTTYNFANSEGQSTVSYSGQITRHVLIEDLKSYVGALTERVLDGSFEPTTAGQVTDELNYYLRFDGDANGDTPHRFSTSLPALQSTYNDISTNKQLLDKLAGNDSSTDHKKWNDGDFKGWAGAASPQALVESWFKTIEDNTLTLVAGTEREVGGEKLPVYVTEQGLDLNQLLQKFLVGAIAFSQAADDYGDDDKEGKGLLSPNTPDGDASYTVLAHAWDEAFGYFGASRDYGTLSDAEISNGCGKDANKDGKLDLTSEVCFGASVNAGKRDSGSVEAARTDFTKEAFDGFVKGRTLIANAGEALTAAELTELKGYRDQWERAWEKAYAATAIHYINEVLGDMDKFGSDDYTFLDHAKHWSELKGFALSFQFNPRSPLSDADFDQLHSLIADAPTLSDAPEAEITAYKDKLTQARELLKKAYAFDDANVQAW